MLLSPLRTPHTRDLTPRVGAAERLGRMRVRVRIVEGVAQSLARNRDGTASLCEPNRGGGRELTSVGYW